MDLDVVDQGTLGKVIMYVQGACGCSRHLAPSMILLEIVNCFVCLIESCIKGVKPFQVGFGRTYGMFLFPWDGQ